ncbi:hypothetical protein K0M31_011267 [Melipona bicolor]|uniref:Uncharacterized protein n=1 Tax=Melipona bicolor TaxID=60889 RepID=A0AA40KUQ6_9HYME|nr:hypothetical protein K0M31_011267 [Melipona bicolor]
MLQHFSNRVKRIARVSGTQGTDITNSCYPAAMCPIPTFLFWHRRRPSNGAYCARNLLITSKQPCCCSKRRRTLLHLYHRISAPWMTWFIMKYFIAGSSLAFVLLNCSVRAMTYTSNLLSSFKPLQTLSNSVKPLVTVVEMVQLSISILKASSSTFPTFDEKIGSRSTSMLEKKQFLLSYATVTPTININLDSFAANIARESRCNAFLNDGMKNRNVSKGGSTSAFPFLSYGRAKGAGQTVMTIVRAKSPYGNVQFVLHKCRGTPELCNVMEKRTTCCGQAPVAAARSATKPNLNNGRE